MRGLIAVLLLVAAAPASERRSAPVRLRETPTRSALPRVTFPRAKFTLVVRRPEGLEGLTGLSPAARFASLRLGEREIVLAFDAPGGASALGLLYCGTGEPVVGRARAMGSEGFAVEFEEATCAGLTCNVRLLHRGARSVSGAIEPANHRRGRIALAGSVREVILVDADVDGRYDGLRDRWVALRADRAKRIRELREPEAMLLDEPQVPFEPDGRALMVESVRRDGAGLVLVLDRPKKTVEEVLGRRYREVREEHFRQFALERATFEVRSGIDPLRPTAKSPTSWRSLPLSKALVLAREAGKPLLVAFYTESNAWFHRYGFYTFPDAEVDALLRRFVLVRIDVEKDPEKSYQGIGARGLPLLMPRTPGGKEVSFRVRHRDAEGTVADLERPETMITGWQRPQELAVNLRRILAAAGSR